MHDFHGGRVRWPMTVVARMVVGAIVLPLLAGCASEKDVAPNEPAPSAPATHAHGADAAFGKFINEPTNPESWRWLCRAAVDGHTAAQFTVAVRYRDGLPPVAQNLPRAFLWFRAAEKGGLTAAALSREAVEKRLPDAEVKTLRKRSGPPTEADCRAIKNSSKKNRPQ